MSEASCLFLFRQIILWVHAMKVITTTLKIFHGTQLTLYDASGSSAACSFFYNCRCRRSWYSHYRTSDGKIVTNLLVFAKNTRIRTTNTGVNLFYSLVLKLSLSNVRKILWRLSRPRAIIVILCR